MLYNSKIPCLSSQLGIRECRGMLQEPSHSRDGITDSGFIYIERLTSINILHNKFNFIFRVVRRAQMMIVVEIYIISLSKYIIFMCIGE